MTHAEELTQIIKKAVNKSEYALRHGLSIGTVNASYVEGADVVLQIDQRRVDADLPTTMIIIQETK